MRSHRQACAPVAGLSGSLAVGGGKGRKTCQMPQGVLAWKREVGVETRLRGSSPAAPPAGAGPVRAAARSHPFLRLHPAQAPHRLVFLPRFLASMPQPMAAQAICPFY